MAAISVSSFSDKMREDIGKLSSNLSESVKRSDSWYRAFFSEEERPLPRPLRRDTPWYLSLSDEDLWYQALADGDCVKVMLSLEKNPELVKVGWHEDERKLVEGRLWLGHWKGRTPLHVAAWRGCLLLANQVLEFFYRRTDSPSDNGNGSLEKLLLAKDGKLKLNALAMAVVNGNQKIIDVLKEGISRNPKNPYDVRDGGQNGDSPQRAGAPIPKDEDVEGIEGQTSGTDQILNGVCRMELRQITEAALSQASDDVVKWKNSETGEGSETPREKLKSAYDQSKNFNFHPFEEFIFHFTFTVGQWEDYDLAMVTRAVQKRILASVFGWESKVLSSTSILSSQFQSFFFELKDGMGRTALHVAIDSSTVAQFISIMPKGPGYKGFMTARDGAGRTPLHRAVIVEGGVFDPPTSSSTVSSTAAVHTEPPASAGLTALDLLLKDTRTDLNATWCYPAMEDFSLDKLSERNGCESYVESNSAERSVEYGYYTALDIAVIHNKISSWNKLLGIVKGSTVPVYNGQCTFQLKLTFDGVDYTARLNSLLLAIIMGNERVVARLLEDLGENEARRREIFACTEETPFTAIHLASSWGCFPVVKSFVDMKEFDPMLKDRDGNSALHHATKWPRRYKGTPAAELYLSLIHYVSCEHVMVGRLGRETSNRDTNAQRIEVSNSDYGVETAIVERKRCVSLLLNAGIDIWKTNDRKQAPDPGPFAPPTFVDWWRTRLENETREAQTRLNNASNAISVIAALVATASYVGPLQPPQGYDSNTSKLHVQSLCVMFFIVCDTFSFYLAVATIILAVIPILPMQEESTMAELRRTRRVVSIALCFLFPSIVCVLMAFAAASIAVIPNHGSWNHGGLTLITAAIGGVFCLGVIYLFIIRLLRLVWPDSLWIRMAFHKTAL